MKTAVFLLYGSTVEMRLANLLSTLCWYQIILPLHVTEAEIDNLAIPRAEGSDDRRTAPKDQRVQSNQRTIMVTGPASRDRRQHYLSTRAIQKTKQASKKQPAVAAPEAADAAILAVYKKKISRKRLSPGISPPASPKQPRKASTRTEHN